MTKENICAICGDDLMSDWSFHDSNNNSRHHYFCHSCRGHYFNGKWWSEKQWEDWIEGNPTEIEKLTPGIRRLSL